MKLWWWRIIGKWKKYERIHCKREELCETKRGNVGRRTDGRTDKQLKKFARYFMIARLKQISREQALHYVDLFVYICCQGFDVPVGLLLLLLLRPLLFLILLLPSSSSWSQITLIFVLPSTHLLCIPPLFLAPIGFHSSSGTKRKWRCPKGKAVLKRRNRHGPINTTIFSENIFYYINVF